MKKKLNHKTSALFLLTLISVLLIVTIVREKGAWSYQENRKLAEFPELSMSAIKDGSYFKDLGAYFTDHFAGRSYWIETNGLIEAETGDSVVNGVYVTDDMLLDVSEKQAPSDDTASIINRFTRQYDGAVYFAAVPSSAGVYADSLPEYLRSDTEKERIDSLYGGLDSRIRKIDAYNILKMLNENYIYYRNDSKWNTYGAYCVYRTVIQKLGFLPTAYDRYTVEHVTGDFRGNLYNKSQYKKIKSDMLDIYIYSDGAEVVSCIGYDFDGNSTEKSLYNMSYIDTNDMYKLYLGEDVPLLKIETSVNNDKKLLVIKNDYANCFIPFLVQHYSEIAVVSVDCLDEGISRLVEVNDYPQTLMLFGMDDFPEEDLLKQINK